MSHKTHIRVREKYTKNDICKHKNKYVLKK